jgi:hypothetical protein
MLVIRGFTAFISFDYYGDTVSLVTGLLLLPERSWITWSSLAASFRESGQEEWPASRAEAEPQQLFRDNMAACAICDWKRLGRRGGSRGWSNWWCRSTWESR